MVWMPHVRVRCIRTATCWLATGRFLRIAAWLWLSLLFSESHPCVVPVLTLVLDSCAFHRRARRASLRRSLRRTATAAATSPRKCWTSGDPRSCVRRCWHRPQVAHWAMDTPGHRLCQLGSSLKQRCSPAGAARRAPSLRPLALPPSTHDPMPPLSSAFG